jgi:trk system potassium uptake protein TrkA
MAKEKVFAVFGLGSFGLEVCRVLAEMGGKVLAFDNQAQNIERIKDSVSQAMLLDSSDEEALKSAPLEDVDVAVVAMGENIEASILTAALLKNIGVPYLIARAVSDVHQRVLRQIGVHEVLNLEIEEGRRLASRLASPEILEEIAVAGDFIIAEMHLPADLAGKKLASLELPRRYQVSVAAVKRTSTRIDDLGNPEKKVSVLFPGGDLELEAEDVLLVLGRQADIERLKEH